MSLDGKTAVVTGGSGVIGFAFSQGLAEAGAKVVVVSPTAARVEAAAQRLRDGGYQALGVAADVTSANSLNTAREQIHAAYGPVDILVNCAGGHKAEAATAADRNFFQISPEATLDLMNLNFVGSLLPSQVFGQDMVERGAGCIVNVSSMSSLRTLSHVMAYSASKAAIDNFTRWLAVHMAENYSPHIRVNAIAPGFFLSKLNHDRLIDKDTGELTPRGQSIVAHTPMRRFGEPDELIGTLLWLVSDAARFVTGIVVPVDGGFSAASGV